MDYILVPAERMERRMSYRVNVMVDVAAWQVLEKLPRGERGRAVNAAILDWARTRKRRDADSRMDAMRSDLPVISTDEVVRWIREDRER